MKTITWLVHEIGAFVGLLGGIAGLIALFRTWLRDRDHIEIRIRPIINKQSLTCGFLFEIVNLGLRRVCISSAGFVLAPFKARSDVLVGAIRTITQHGFVDKFPYNLESGELCRIPVNAKDLVFLEKTSLRPFVRLASQKFFRGSLIQDPNSYFAYGRNIDTTVEDAVIQSG